MKSVTHYIALVICIVSLFSCSSNSSVGQANWVIPNGKIKVLSSTSMIDDIVKQVGGEYVDNISMIKGELDPHTYQLVKGDDEKLAAAQVIFYNGLGLEHGPSLQSYLQNHPKAIALGDHIKSINPELIIYFNNQMDPHIWMDISLWSRIVPQIVTALSEVDPLHKDYYLKNGEKVLNDMKLAHDNVREKLMQVPDEKRFLVTSHDAFNYFTRAYLATDQEKLDNSWQKRFAAPEGLAPDSQLSSTHIQMILDHLAKYNIHVIFPESNVSKDSIKKILFAGKENGLTIGISKIYLYGDAMGAPGSDGDTYLKMIQHNANVISEHLMK